ncbi:unnamed protein product, partial [Acanthoscelides obtectus]
MSKELLLRIGIPSFVCQKSSPSFEKSTHQDNASAHTAKKTRQISLLSRKLKTDCVVKGSSHRKKQLTHSKMPFSICQQTSGISASKIGSSACRYVSIFVEN